MKEARLVPDMKVIGVKNMKEMVCFLKEPKSYKEDLYQEETLPLLKSWISATSGVRNP